MFGLSCLTNHRPGRWGVLLGLLACGLARGGFAAPAAPVGDGWIAPVRLPRVVEEEQPNTAAAEQTWRGASPVGPSWSPDYSPPTVSDVAPPSDPCSLCQTGCACGSPWLENLSLFLGLDGAKQPQDFGVNANFGGRAAVNWGVPVVESLGIGLQIGTAIDATSNAVKVFDRVQGNSGRTQSFTTVGLFQRTESGWLWGFGYDFLHETYYDTFNLGQWRVRAGYELRPEDEVGAWASIAAHSDTGTFGGIPVTLTPITQGFFYWRHTWQRQAQTTIWLGMADHHSQPNLALGDLPPIRSPFAFGSSLFVPLNDRVALFGEANFITPSSTGTVDAYLGFQYFPGTRAVGAPQKRFAPVLPVASPPTFAVDLAR